MMQFNSSSNINAFPIAISEKLNFPNTPFFQRLMGFVKRL